MPLSPALGAEVSGVDIAAGIDQEQFAELRQASPLASTKSSSPSYARHISITA
jgi:alpha-ketoglutarate-dependent taurine dioxygenase